MFQLSDGSGMAVTIARYETPAHINIDKVHQLFTNYLFYHLISYHRMSELHTLLGIH